MERLARYRVCRGARISLVTVLAAPLPFHFVGGFTQLSHHSFEIASSILVPWYILACWLMSDEGEGANRWMSGLGVGNWDRSIGDHKPASYTPHKHFFFSPLSLPLYPHSPLGG